LWFKTRMLGYGAVVLKDVPVCAMKSYMGIIYWIKYLITYILTPRGRVLLEKITGSQLVKKFPAFYGTRRFITTFTSARHLSLSWSSSHRGMPSLILNFVTRSRRVVSLTPQSLYPLGKRLQRQLNRGLSGPDTRSGRFGEKKNILLLQGVWTPDHPARSLVIIRTTISRLIT
jgi:hypothetical protein